MNEMRKMVFISIIISLVVGSFAGVAGGIVASQIATGNMGQSLVASLPLGMRGLFLHNPSQSPSPGLRPPSPVGRGEGEGVAPAPPATNEEGTTIDAVHKVAPAVVSVLVSKEVAAQTNNSPFSDDFFKQFGFDIQVPQQPEPQTPQGPAKKQQIGGGSGFIITPDGMIVTNKHVIFDDEATYTVVTADGKHYDAKVLAKDSFMDLAVLKIDAKNLPTVKLGDSDRLQIGETVVAIGNALAEFSNTITKGVVSGIKRRVTAGGPGIGSEVLDEAIQTDAAINPGNSGGPLINLRGEVVGINTAVSQAGQNLGFAIPINQVKSVIESVRTSGKIVRTWLGVRYIIITPEMKTENQLPVDYGALVVRGQQQTQLAVIPGSPADKAGIRENDIILEIDHLKITEDAPLANQIQKHKPGDTVPLKVLSQGKEKEVKVVLEELKQ